MQTSLLHDEEQPRPVCACCTPGRLKWSGFSVALLGCALLLVAIFLPPVIQSKLDAGIKDGTSISPDAQQKNSQSYRTWADWTDPDALPVYDSVYMYNITNSADILADPSTKPVVTQHGPYVFREFKKKFDIEYGSDADGRQTVSYREWVWWQPAPELTAAGLDADSDKYVTFNLPLQGVLATLATSGQLSQLWGLLQGVCALAGDDISTDQGRLFTNKVSVAQLLFGYKDACSTAFIPSSADGPAGYFPGLLGFNRPPGAQWNTTTMRPLIAKDTVYTGDVDDSYARQFVQWKGEQYVSAADPLSGKAQPIWATPAANRVHGVAGEQFARGLQDGQVVSVWTDQLSRESALENVDSLHVRDLHGLDLMRFVLSPRLMLNATQNPDNAAFYMNEYNGLLNLSSSKDNLAVFVSKPHFLDADSSLREDIVGMHPSRDLHETYLDVEPLSGATMRASKKLQFNLRLAPQSWNSTAGPVHWYAHTGIHFVPVAWVDEHGEIDSADAAAFEKAVYGAIAAKKFLTLLGAIFGSVLIAMAIALWLSAVSRAGKQRQTESIQDGAYALQR